MRDRWIFFTRLPDQKGGKLFLLTMLVVTSSWIWSIHQHLFPQHIFFIIWLFSLLYLFRLLLSSVQGRGPHNDWKMPIYFFCWTLLWVELILAGLGVGKNLGDSSLGYYWAPYYTRNVNYYYAQRSSWSYRLTTKEYSFGRKSNRLGFPDHEWAREKKAGSYRIICLGDSFTEGDGAPYDSSYVSLLREKLREKYPSVEVLNAGNCGSDPFFNFKNLSDRLIAYQPDLVIQSVTKNDIDTDVMVRGGMERFQKDSTLKFRYHYWWEPVYASSYIVRLLTTTIGGYNNLLIRKKDVPRMRSDAERQTLELFNIYKVFSKQHSFDLLVFSVPFKQEFETGYRNEVYQLLAKIGQTGIRVKNLKSCYDDYLIQNRKPYTTYYWKNDGHHNARGYEMMALCLQPEIERYLEKFYGKDSTGN